MHTTHLGAASIRLITLSCRTNPTQPKPSNPRSRRCRRTNKRGPLSRHPRGSCRRLIINITYLPRLGPRHQRQGRRGQESRQEGEAIDGGGLGRTRCLLRTVRRDLQGGDGGAQAQGPQQAQDQGQEEEVDGRWWWCLAGAILGAVGEVQIWTWHGREWSQLVTGTVLRQRRATLT